MYGSLLGSLGGGQILTDDPHYRLRGGVVEVLFIVFICFSRDPTGDLLVWVAFCFKYLKSNIYFKYMFYPPAPAITYTHNFLTSALATMTIEGLVGLLLFVYFLSRKEEHLHLKKLSVFLATFFVSMFTLPYVWFIFPTLMMWTRNTSLWFSEFFIFSVEAIVYRFFLKLPWRWAILISLIANLASYFIPIWMRSIGLWPAI